MTEREYALVEVLLQKGAGSVYSKIDIEDQSRVLAIASKWRLSSNGYAIVVRRIHGKVCTTYLHKTIFGSACRHINGDRLDNRRFNLSASPRTDRGSELAIRKLPDLELNSESEEHDGFQIKVYHVDTPDEKIYVGHMKDNMPHGFGVLTIKPSKQLIGEWVSGQMITGSIHHYMTPPNLCPIEIPIVGWDIFKIEHVINGFIV